MIDRGELPNLARLVAGGSSGNMGTLEPRLSPMLWTSIATGKRPPKHGIFGFSEPTHDGQSVRPITILGRTTKAVWNILNQNGLRPCVVGWWPSHPAEPVNGVIVSNLVHQAGEGPQPAPMPAGAVYPESWTDRIAGLRITPMDLPGEVIRAFVPEYDRVDQGKDGRIHSLGRVIAETINLHAAATEVIEHAEWDFAAIYYDAIDHFGHLCMKYHPPRLPWVDETDFAIYQHVIATAYRYHDVMLGRLLELAGPDVTVILISDHGFHPDNSRPDYIPAEAAGPAVEHRTFGIVVLSGPGIKRGEVLYGSSLLDVVPTILHLFGLPLGQDMDGKVLVTAFERPGAIESVKSWDAIDGDAGLHPPGVRFDSVGSAEAMKQLVALGYVAAPGDDAAEAVAECLAELKYNLASAHDDAGRPDLSRPLYESLLQGDPGDQRYAHRLIAALIKVGDHEQARAVLDRFDAHCAVAAPEAQTELDRRGQAKATAELDQKNDQDYRELSDRRRLAERATGFVQLRHLLRFYVDFAGGRLEEATRGLNALEQHFRETPQPPMLFLAAAHARLRYDDQAHAWLDAALERDPEDWRALAMAARLHLRNRRFAAALDSATASLALIYFQPVIHFVMGRALAARGDLDGAERAFRVAVTQMPGLIAAHEALVRLYLKLGRRADADIHRNRAAEFRLQARKGRLAEPPVECQPVPAVPLPGRNRSAPADPAREVVVVAGLPRSGTSMLMQFLAAGGVVPLTDGRRPADSDNSRGYYEFEPATRLAQDQSWLPLARGKVVKLALPLVVHLPLGESYRLILIERDAREVIASQGAMLKRLGRARQAADLDDERLATAYARQREQVRAWLERRPEVAVLPLRYDDFLADPNGTARHIVSFLNRDLDTEAAARAVDPTLRRQFARR